MAVTQFPSAGGVSRSGTTTDGHLAVWNGSSVDSIKDGGTVPNGNVTGPASAVTGHLATFADTSGKVLVDGGAVPSGAIWGSITGTLSNQTDLNTALAGKASASLLCWTPASTPVSIAASTTTFSCPNSLSFNATESSRQIMMPLAGSLFTLVIKTNTTQASDGTLTATLRINGVDTTLVITVPVNGVAAVYHDVTHTVTVAEGDLVSLKFINASPTVNASMQNWSLCFR